MTERRPNPDELLGKLKQKQAKQHRGRLKIFFGACAGVGKTFAMLSAARALSNQKLDVVVGFIETHGRTETAELLKGLTLLPTKSIEYRGKMLTEFDLDAALTRRPAVILIDELAHTNVKGSRHTKRWQDVEELINAGIDVYTTVNVQHLESLTDVISHITGIKISETFPDSLFNSADEVKLVDLPPDELLTRLKEGKVYVPEQTKYAIENFFRKGNLIALRELALRRMADRVDMQMREYRDDQSIERVWQTKERLLVCVGPEESSERIIRKAYRFATSLRADWFAVYVETPHLQKLPKNKRDQILKNLKLAQELGAETNLLAGTNLAEILIDYARSHNIAKIIVGKPLRSRLSRFFRPTLAEVLTNQQADIDIYIVERTSEPTPNDPKTTSPSASFEFDIVTKTYWPGYIWSLGTCGLITLLSAGLINYLSLSNIAMLYLLGVAIIATRFGRGPSVLASFISVGLFDFYFVAPTWSFIASNSQYLITFTVMLTVALIISNLTSNLRYQARIAVHRERRTSASNALSKELAAALTIPQITEISIRHLSNVFQAKVSLLLPDNHNKVHPQTAGADPGLQAPNCDLGIAQWVFDNEQPAGVGTQTLPASSILYLPLPAPMRIRGVLAIEPTNAQQIFLPEQQRLLDTFAAQIALSIEHLHYVAVARDALLTMESERLRDALLSAISHALYSPLTTVLELSDQLVQDHQTDNERFELARTIHERATRMHSLVSNLLDMARLQVGDIELNKQWSALPEIINQALKKSQIFLSQHSVTLNLPLNLPLVQLDPVLMERVFYHLLENAGEYTPIGSIVQISAEHRSNEILVYVEDNGPGLPPGMEEKIFEKFIRGAEESNIPGVGLGLAICRAILEAHGQEIYAENRPQGGAKFTIRIPLSS